MDRLDDLPFTTRGWAVASVVVGAVVLGLLFGARSLNAVAAPAALALAIAVWRIRGVEPRSCHRRLDTVIEQGEFTSVHLAFEGIPSRLARVTDTVPSQLESVGNGRLVPLETGLEYDLKATERGEYQLGPVTVQVTDLFGLVERSVELEANATITVVPRRHHVDPPALSRLAAAADLDLDRDRSEFDRLREYQPTDSLRDVHWKSSAKRPGGDFIVKEFVTDRDRGALMLSGAALYGADNELAEAMASIASAFVEAGVGVGLLTPDGRVDPIRQPGELNKLLVHLASIGPGRPSTQTDIHLVADSDAVDDVTLHVNDTEVTFGELRDGRAALDEDVSTYRAIQGGIAD